MDDTTRILTPKNVATRGPVVVNFTGGTKLMSIAAYAAAQNAGWTSLYVDTEGRQFIDGKTGERLSEILGGPLAFDKYLAQLSVRAIAAANGLKKVETSPLDIADYRKLAVCLLNNRNYEQKTWQALQPLRELKNPQKCLEALNCKIVLPPPVAKLAIDAGLVEAGGAPGAVVLPQAFREPLQSRNKERQTAAKNSLQQIVNFFSGAWWEVAVADTMLRSSKFVDLLWSAEFGDGSPLGMMEEDVIASDGVRITYVSCKRGGGLRERFLPLLDEINSRAQRLGGRFAEKYLALYIRPEPQVLQAVESRARELGIRLVFPGTLEADLG